jgi:hypothetical protein
MGNYSAEYHNVRDHNEKANALRQRQLNDQLALTRLKSRTDYVVEPGVIGTQNQSLQRIPMGDYQRLPVGEQIVRDPSSMREVIMPTPMKAVPPAKAVSVQPYSPKIQQPLTKVPSTLYAMRLPTGAPVKKWPTSFKKVFHKPTMDENILRGLNNLDGMSRSLMADIHPRRK